MIALRQPRAFPSAVLGPLLFAPVIRLTIALGESVSELQPDFEVWTQLTIEI